MTVNYHNPTADDVAIAVVAGCRETGDDPLSTVQGGLGIGRATNRARHYALHALVHVFPKANRFKLCEWVGCPGKPAMFWNASWNQVVRPRATGLGHMANWFDDEAYDRVIRAIEADRTRRAVAAPPKPAKPENEPPPYRPPAGAMKAVLEDEGDDRPVMDRTGFAGPRPRYEKLPASKAELYEDLRRAAENTARLQPKGE